MLIGNFKILGEARLKFKLTGDLNKAILRGGGWYMDAPAPASGSTGGDGLFSVRNLVGLPLLCLQWPKWKIG